MNSIIVASNTLRFRTGLFCLGTLLAFASASLPSVSAQTLPHHGTATSSSTLWWITQLGLGPAGEFNINNAGNTNPALFATTNGTGPALTAVQNGNPNIYNQVAVSVTSNAMLSTGVYSTARNGYAGRFDGYYNGVIGTASQYYGSGLEGQADTAGGTGVYGHSANGVGGYFEGGSSAVTAYGYAPGSYGINAHSYGDYTSIGVLGVSNAYGYGVYGESTYGFGIYGYSPYGDAGGFAGNVAVTGILSAGAKYFKIDHPLDPANKYLVHSCVESDQMTNLYSGHVVLDAEGSAWVDLPDWFQALNKDFEYHLTPIGAPAPNLYIAQEIQNNRFEITGGKPGMKVSWQVTGIRQDPFAKAHPLQAEQDKPKEKRGTFLHPRELGLSDERGEDYVMNQRRRK